MLSKLRGKHTVNIRESGWTKGGKGIRGAWSVGWVAVSSILEGMPCLCDVDWRGVRRTIGEAAMVEVAGLSTVGRQATVEGKRFVIALGLANHLP